MTYLSATVFDYRPNFDELESGQLDDFAFESTGSGAFTPWKPTTKPKRSGKIPFILPTPEDQRAFRLLVQAMEGPRNGFWLPLWTSDYVATEDALASAVTIRVRAIGLEQKRSFGEQFQHLAIATIDKLECYEIDSVTDLGGGVEEITLTTGLSTALDSNVSAVFGLIWARIEGDEIEYSFPGGWNVAEVTLNWTELGAQAAEAETSAKHAFLYVFTRGTVVWRWCNYPVAVTVGSDTFAPADITHGQLRSGTDFLAEEFELTIATDDPASPFAESYARNWAVPVMVDVYRVDLEAIPGALPAADYTGMVVSAAVSTNGGMTLQCSSVMRLSELQVPVVAYSRLCPFRLFDENCGVAESTYTTAGTIDAITSDYVEASEWAAKATAESDVNWFAMGKVVVGDEVRLVTGQDGGKLYVNLPFRDAIVGDAASATTGCNKRLSGCTKHANTSRTMQFTYIPRQNPQLEALATPKSGGGKKG